MRAIKRINAHVRVEALAAEASTVLLSTAIKPSVLTLMIAPSELAFASAHHGAPSPAQVAY